MNTTYTLERKLKNGKFPTVRIPSKRTILIGLNLVAIIGSCVGFVYAQEVILQELSKSLILVSLLSLLASLSNGTK
jgi:hypothetical protein